MQTKNIGNESYPDRVLFNETVAAYKGPEAVTIDCTPTIKGGSSPSIDYYTHSADGSISTTGPTD